MTPVKELELRDWFAGQALTAILNNPNTPKPEDMPLEQHAASLAEQAYTYADAMVKQRPKQPPEAAALAGAPVDAKGAFAPLPAVPAEQPEAKPKRPRGRRRKEEQPEPKQEGQPEKEIPPGLQGLE
jgi:hypothetical protein